jgi:hypothetical protein
MNSSVEVRETLVLNKIYDTGVRYYFLARPGQFHTKFETLLLLQWVIESRILRNISPDANRSMIRLVKAENG